MKIVSINPSTYQPVGEIEVSSTEEIKAKVDAAHGAKKTWQELGVAGRVELRMEKGQFHIHANPFDEKSFTLFKAEGDITEVMKVLRDNFTRIG